MSTRVLLKGFHKAAEQSSAILELLWAGPISKSGSQLTYVFVAYNLAVVSHISDRIAVTYLGKIVEIGEAASLSRNPHHTPT